MKEILKYKRYMRMFIAGVISRFGDSVDMIAFGYMVYALTGSKVLLASIYVCNVLPNILFSTFTGTLVDFFSKKKIILMGDIIRGGVVLTTAMLFQMGLLQTWHLFAFTFINSTVETFVSPAKFATIPKLVSEEHYLTVNSTMRSFISLAELIGLGMGGVLVGWMGVAGAFLVDATTFFLSAMIIATVRFPEEEKKQLTRTSYAEAYKGGLQYLWKTKVILAFVLTAALLNFLLTPLNAFMPAYVAEIMKMGPEGIGFLSSSFSIGIILGGIVTGLIGKKLGVKALAFNGLFFAGMAYLGMGLPGVINLFDHVLVICGFAAIIGAMVSMAGAGLSTFVMTITPKDMLSRLGAVMTMLSQIATPAGAFVSAVLVAFLPLSIIMAIAGSAFMVVALFPVVALTRYERKNKMDQVA